MRTSLEYVVQKEDKYNFKKDKLVSVVVSRGFAFCVDNCKTEKEHNSAIDSFVEFLDKHNVKSYGFGGGTWEDAKRQNDEKNFVYLDIPIRDMDEKEYVKELYKEWKKGYKNAD